MLAVGFEWFGGPEVLHVVELPDPEPGPGEVVVAVEAATVNPTDTLMRSGQQAAAMREQSPPFVPGMELAGRVVALGQQVLDLAVGDPVMGIVNPRRAEGGALAERVRVPAASVVRAPAGLAPAAAATLPMNGLTALKAVEAAGVKAGDWLMVTGATGALGGYACQVATHRGVRVVAGADVADHDLLRELGVEAVVPRSEGLADAVREVVPDGVAAVVDAALLGDTADALVRDGGTSVSVRGPRDGDPRLRHAVVSVTRHAEDAGALRTVAELAAAGVLVPRVAHVLTWDRAARAHTLVEQGGLRGRVVLVPPPDVAHLSGVVTDG